MALIGANELKRKMLIAVEGQPYVVLDVFFASPTARGAAERHMAPQAGGQDVGPPQAAGAVAPQHAFAELVSAIDQQAE